jgi:hypothetical protein
MKNKKEKTNVENKENPIESKNEETKVRSAK